MWKPAISALILLTTWISAPPARAAQPSQKVRIGYSTMSATTAPLWVAQDEGFLSKHGIDSDLIFIPGPSIVIASLNRGDVTLAMVGGSTVLAGAAGGIELQIIAAILNRVTVDAGLLTGTFSLRLKRMGFGFMGDIDRIQSYPAGLS
jgi:ABC-type nitrate/sulfonate/bicarbonate transport system substrate-binding protein